uniref:Uncharacterized protein n=1 Tax=Oryza meridionalis TaxID=40149 RepID=A0A0E0F548_9ORYZ
MALEAVVVFTAGGEVEMEKGELQLFLSVWSALDWNVRGGDAAGREAEMELGVLRTVTRRVHASAAPKTPLLPLSRL